MDNSLATFYRMAATSLAAGQRAVNSRASCMMPLQSEIASLPGPHPLLVAGVQASDIYWIVVAPLRRKLMATLNFTLGGSGKC